MAAAGAQGPLQAAVWGPSGVLEGLLTALQGLFTVFEGLHSALRGHSNGHNRLFSEDRPPSTARKGPEHRNQDLHRRREGLLCRFSRCFAPPYDPLRALPAEEPALEFEGLIEVSEVLLDVAATDVYGESVTGLDTDDFVVEEDGKPVRLTSVSYYTTRYGVTRGKSRSRRALRRAPACDSLTTGPCRFAPTARRLEYPLGRRRGHAWRAPCRTGRTR